MDFTTKVQISKLQAAQRQLDCALWLWFISGDEVSIHTLACSAHQILNDIHEGRGIGHKLIFGSNAISEENRRHFVSEFKKATNFFKHADNDPHAVLDFMPGMTEGFLMAGVIGLFNLDIQASDVEKTFFAWQVLHSPELFDSIPQEIGKYCPPEAMDAARNASRFDFFHIFMNGLRQARVQ